MNKIYKVVWSKAKHAYIVTSEVARSHTKSASGKAVKAVLAATVGMGVLMGGYAADAAPATNPAGNGPGIAVGTSSSADRNTSVAVGDHATTTNSNGATGGGGDVAVGHNARTNNYVNQSGSVAVGENAFAENMAGKQESMFNFGQTTFTGSGFLGMQAPFIPADPSKVVGSVAVGQNAYARSGGTMVGTHNYSGDIGDTTVNNTEATMRSHNVSVNATTIGTNSYNNSAFGVINGSYSAITGSYDGGAFSSKASQNFGATITGSLNSIESKTASSNYSGIANSIVGTANRTFNSNGSLIFGAGNEITNSVTRIVAPSSGGNSAKELADKVRTAVKNSNSGGSTMAFGGGNRADYTLRTALVGVNNTVTGTSAAASADNSITGFHNTATNVNHVTVTGSENTISDTNHAVVIGDNRTLQGANNSVILGSHDTGSTTNVSDAVAIGRNTNVTQAGGVAIGSGSLASVGAGVAGYDPSTHATSTNTTSVWQATDAAVSVGDGTTRTRQITSVAAGTNDTDAVNVAQLKQAIGNNNNMAIINKLGNKVNRVGAGAAALAALHPLDFDPDDKWDFAAGYGNYSGANAVAVGAFYRPNEDTMLSVGGSFGAGENMVNAGVSVKLGQGNHVSTSKVAMAKEIVDLRDENKDLKKRLDTMEQKMNSILGILDMGKKKDFPDVPENHWAYEYVATLAGNGIIEGYPDGEFKGDRSMTRYEFAAMFYRALKNGAPVDDNMDRAMNEFEPELRQIRLDRIRVDRISGKDNDRNKVERVRVNSEDDKAKNDYRDVYGSHISPKA